MRCFQPILEDCAKLNCFSRVAQRSLLTVLLCASLSQAAEGASKVTFKVRVIANLIVMPGNVNNSRPLNIVLDSGASDNILVPELVSDLRLKLTSSATAAGLGKGQDETEHISPGNRLAWGPDKQLRLGDQRVAALPISDISEQTGYPLDGIFGSSLFQNFQIHVDYDHAEVTFAQGEPPPAGGVAVPLRLYGGIPFVEATLETAAGGKVPGLFLVDSGTTAPLILSRKFLEAHPSVMAGHKYVNAPPAVAVGGRIDLQLVRVTGLKLGSFRLAAPVAAVPQSTRGALANGNIAGFIGAGILSRFTVDWDYKRQTMVLTCNHRFGEPFESDASGLRLNANKPDWRTIRIASVTPRGPADEAGVEAGDHVQMVNGKTPPPLYELSKLLAQPGTSIKITLRRAGRQKTVTIHLRKLV
jgi:hypothetical protein